MGEDGGRSPGCDDRSVAAGEIVAKILEIQLHIGKDINRLAQRLKTYRVGIMEAASEAAHWNLDQCASSSCINDYLLELETIINRGKHISEDLDDVLLNNQHVISKVKVGVEACKLVLDSSNSNLFIVESQLNLVKEIEAELLISVNRHCFAIQHNTSFLKKTIFMALSSFKKENQQEPLQDLIDGVKKAITLLNVRLKESDTYIGLLTTSIQHYDAIKQRFDHIAEVYRNIIDECDNSEARSVDPIFSPIIGDITTLQYAQLKYILEEFRCMHDGIQGALVSLWTNMSDLSLLQAWMACIRALTIGLIPDREVEEFGSSQSGLNRFSFIKSRLAEVGIQIKEQHTLNRRIAAGSINDADHASEQLEGMAVLLDLFKEESLFFSELNALINKIESVAYGMAYNRIFIKLGVAPREDMESKSLVEDEFCEILRRDASFFTSNLTLLMEQVDLLGRNFKQDDTSAAAVERGLSEIRRMYTMQSERLVYESVCGERMSELVPDSGNTPLGDILEDANLELF